MELFGKRLSSARKQSGMTQSEVAERLEVSFQAVSLWERGETSPEITKLAEIAALFHVTTDWLLTGKEDTEVFFDADTDVSDRLFNEERMYTYVKTYATMKGMNQTLRVLPYARELHKGQFRKGKDKVPYIYHPLLISCHALSLGLDDDNLISAAILHDVCEDCGVLPEELPVNEETREVVVLLTKDNSPSGETDAANERYYGGIEKNKYAIMIKLLDRCNNVSGMAAAFSKQKMANYIRGTEKWIYPLFDKAKAWYPEHSNQVFLIKYHMTSVVEALKRQMI
ncbi:MAG: helix-turn-helix domain-containing protein [Lachnospiraceae bacterium]|nr:helix-turn-helix domain-containing protein [Lachnospiraceae bacterium]